MSSSRIATSLLRLASRSALHTSSRHLRFVPTALNGASSRFNSPSNNQSQQQQQQQRIRFYSQDTPKQSKIYFFEDIKTHISSPQKQYILIDVREPHELKTTGTIPGSINIPITTKPDSFFISPEEFEERYGFERPGKEEEVVFFCRAGVRSRAAAELARQGGWVSVGEYPGAWMDWEAKGGEKESVK